MEWGFSNSQSKNLAMGNDSYTYFIPVFFIPFPQNMFFSRRFFILYEKRISNIEAKRVQPGSVRMFCLGPMKLPLDDYSWFLPSVLPTCMCC